MWGPRWDNLENEKLSQQLSGDRIYHFPTRSPLTLPHYAHRQKMYWACSMDLDSNDYDFWEMCLNIKFQPLIGSDTFSP